MMGPPMQAMKKFDGKFSRFDTIHQRDRQTDKQTDTARQQRPRYGQRRAVKNATLSHYTVLIIVCFCYTLLLSDCFG